MTKPNPMQGLASVLLKKDLSAWVADRRSVGMAWDGISRELHAATKGQADVTGETLRRWYGQAESTAAA